MTADDITRMAREAGFEGMTDHPALMRFANLVAAHKAMEQPVQEPTPWRDMVVVSLVREGVNKHKARELADHFAAQQQAESLSMRMPKVGDKVICLEDESLGEVVSLTAGGSPDIVFDDGSRGTYLLREFAELFGYAEQRQQQAEPPPEWPLIKNILAVFGLDAIAFVAAWKAAQQQAESVGEVIEVNNDGFKCEFNRRLAVGTKLYTTPPLPVQEPLEQLRPAEFIQLTKGKEAVTGIPAYCWSEWLNKEQP